MSNVPDNYLAVNSQQTKNPVIVVKIDDVPDILSNRPVNTRILYGDPGVVYGGAGLTYGGLRPYVNASGGTFRNLLDLAASSLTIGQRLEPEQGKASVTSLSLGFIDFQGYMTSLLTPGLVIDEILGAQVSVFLGYTEISYPEDFFEVFRGYISGVEDGSGKVVIQVSDPNLKRRQQLFFMGQTLLTGTISSGSGTIFVTSTEDFFKQITYPDGGNFLTTPYCHCYILIDDEWIEVQPMDSFTDRFDVIARGARGTTAAAHTTGAQVSAGFQLGDIGVQPNAMDQALQVMLSGWDGPWISGETLLAIGPEADPDPSVTTTNFITLPINVDADKDYGLVLGDWITLTGSAHGANNDTPFQVIDFADLDDQSNRLIYLNATLEKEADTPALMSIRSQYDVLPILAGLKMKPTDVDIAQHLYIKTTFLGGPGNDLIFFMTSQADSGKNFLELQIYLPTGAYSLTRRGRVSVGYHSPPIANQQIFFLSGDNVLNPTNITVTRALNQRAFFNEINIAYNYNDQGESLATLVVADAADGGSIDQIGLTSVLPISAQGVYNGYSAGLLEQRAFFLLARYKRGAVMFQVKVNWEVGSLMETGDIVTFVDDGTLQIANFQTGTRSIGGQLFEIIDRTFDLKSGNITIKVVGGVSATLSDRFATISPSSMTDTGSTSTRVIIKDSFGALFPGNESEKWVNYIGLPVLVHSVDYSVEGTGTLVAIDPTNNYALQVTDLGFTPPAGYVVDIANYPDSTDQYENALYKVMHAFWDPTVSVVSASDDTHFDVDPGDIDKFHVGAPIRIHSEDYVTDSGDLTVLSITVNTIETSASMGFTPVADDQVDLIGFPDFTTVGTTGQPYRWI